MLLKTSTQKKGEKRLPACRGEGSVVGLLLAARALLLRCAASTMLSSTLAMPNIAGRKALLLSDPISSNNLLQKATEN
jgi:hypothetical protein